jgi:hypothetical protein
MSRPCSQCKNEVLDADAFCKYCLATKCLHCEPHGSIVRFTHDQLSAHHQEHEEATSKASAAASYWIQCPADLCDGCGTINPANQRNCNQCQKKLWITSTMSTPMKTFYLGQVVYFMRRDTGFPVRGFIVDEGSSTDHAIVRYYERCYRFARYDESCSMSEIFLSLDEANAHVKSRRRGSSSSSRSSTSTTAIVRPPPSSQPSQSQKATKSTASVSKTKSPPTIKIPEKTRASSPPKLKPKQSPDRSASLSPVKKPKQVRASLDVVDSLTDHSASSVSASSIRSSSWLDYPVSNYDVDTIQASITIPDNPCNILTGKAMLHIDEFILRGLAYAINHWLRPLSKTADTVSSSSTEDRFTIRMLEELLKYCPTTEAELAAIISCESLQLTRNSAGESLLDAIRSYLTGRSCLTATSTSNKLWRSRSRAAIDQLKALRLELPLRYPVFLSIVELAYESVGGRINLENSRGVKGLVKVQGDQVAMYGGKLA